MDGPGGGPRSSPQFEVLLERAPEEIYLLRGDGSFAWVNEAAAKSLGYGRAELLALPLSAIDPDARRFVEGTLPAQPFEGVHLTRDGRRVPKELCATRVDGLTCVFARDISARQRAHGELLHIGRLYALLSQINHAIVEVKSRATLFEHACKAAIDFGFHMAWVGLLDEDGLVRPVAQAGHLDGYLDELVIDTRDERLSCGPTGVAVREGRLDVCADIAGEQRMKPWLQRALARGYLASAAIPLRTRGRSVGALSLYAAEPGFFSARECQLLQQVGEELSFALEVLDSAAERELLRAQLDQARKLESVGRFAGGLAHDFNNLLTVILSSLEVALETVGPGHAARTMLEESRDAALRSAALTGQLLTVARLQPRRPRVLALNDTIDGSLKLLARLVGPGVDLRWSPAPELWPVCVDPSQVDQLLTNLCANARDAMNGKGRLTLSTANVMLEETAASALTLPAGAYVSLRVADDGAGMSAEVLGRLFEPFFSTKAHGKGTGLGLATVYGIVKQNGGHVAVESLPGQGSSFTLYLPRHEP